MKLKTSLIALGTVTVILVAPFAMASGMGPGAGPRAALEFSALDTDGDGHISRAEFTAGVQALRQSAGAARLDQIAAEMMTHANADGMLGAEELRGALEAMAADRQDRMTEMRAARQDNRAGRHAEGHDERRAERGADRQMRRGGPDARSAESRLTRMFDRMDADGDGMLSAAEFEVAQSRMAAHADRRNNAPTATE